MLTATCVDNVQHQGHEYVCALDVPALESAVLLIVVLCSGQVFLHVRRWLLVGTELGGPAGVSV